MSESSVTDSGMGELQTDLLQGPGKMDHDLRLVHRAVKEGWAIDTGKREIIIKRLMETVAKREVQVSTMEGPVMIDGPADTNANAAARVLVAMDSLNQTDYWNADKNARIDAGQATERVALDPVILRQPVKPE